MSFYRHLGADGLAAIAPEFTSSDRTWLLRQLRGRTRVLDAGCGFGRVALPLAAAGHHVHGFDLDAGLVAAARRNARGRRLPLRFSVGDLRDPPVPAGRFDAVVCLWSTFQHLLTGRDRRAALAGFHRCLRPGGACVLEMSDGGEPRLATALARHGLGPDRRIAAWHLHGAAIRCYIHDRSTLDAALADSPFARHRIATRRVNGVSRLVGLAWKAGGIGPSPMT